MTQWRKNTRLALFLFAGRVSGVFCMKINQENLNYHKNKFHSKSSQCDLRIPSSNDWVYFFISKRVWSFLPKVDSCKKLRQFCQFFLSSVWAVPVECCERNWTVTMVFSILKRNVLIHQPQRGVRGQQSWSGKNPNPNKAGERADASFAFVIVK